MKKIVLAAALLCSFAGFSQIRMPAPSPTQKISQEFGLGKIELTYSRPNIKGRPLLKEGSELAPLGQLWRTGANAATRLYFSDNVMMGGKLLDTGSYVLYTIPGKETWEIVINKGLSNWGTDGYKESEDVVRFKVKALKMANPMETFTMQFANIQPESCELHLMWATTAVSIPMSTSIKDRIRAQVEKALSADPVNPANYQAAANFYFEWTKEYDKALANAKKATDANPKAFWLFLLTAKIQKELGDKVAAKASAEKCIAIATEAKNDDYVRFGKDLIRKL
jgi:tetratricopeptide (TPR) repeat protein